MQVNKAIDLATTKTAEKSRFYSCFSAVSLAP
jgi:hypothetical protein